MTPKHARYAVFTFLLLSTGVAGNIMFMQDHQGAGRGVAARAQPRATIDRTKRAVADTPAETIHANAFTANPVIAPQPPTKPPGKAPATDSTTPPGPAETGDVTASIQRELQTRGYEPGAPNGTASIITRAAIMAWEFDNGLALTGEPTEAIGKAIVLGVSKSLTAQIQAQYQALPKDKRARTEQLVRTVQSALSALGYNVGRATGRVNEDTERSIREFEVDQNMTQSGRISGPLVARLNRLSGIGRVGAAR